MNGMILYMQFGIFIKCKVSLQISYIKYHFEKKKKKKKKELFQYFVYNRMKLLKILDFVGNFFLEPFFKLF